MPVTGAPGLPQTHKMGRKNDREMGAGLKEGKKRKQEQQSMEENHYFTKYDIGMQESTI